MITHKRILYITISSIAFSIGLNVAAKTITPGTTAKTAAGVKMSLPPAGPRKLVGLWCLSAQQPQTQTTLEGTKAVGAKEWKRPNLDYTGQLVITKGFGSTSSANPPYLRGGQIYKCQYFIAEVGEKRDENGLLEFTIEDNGNNNFTLTFYTKKQGGIGLPTGIGKNQYVFQEEIGVPGQPGYIPAGKAKITGGTAFKFTAREAHPQELIQAAPASQIAGY
jgi:hypothetical protein